MLLLLVSDCNNPWKTTLLTLLYDSLWLSFVRWSGTNVYYLATFNHFVFCTIRDNCPPPQNIAQQQQQQQQPVPPTFSPILARSADGFSPRHPATVQQQQQQQSTDHHYRSQPAEPHYHQQRHAAVGDGSQSWNEWTQQLLVRFLLFFFVVALDNLLPWMRGYRVAEILFFFQPRIRGCFPIYWLDSRWRGRVEGKLYNAIKYSSHELFMESRARVCAHFTVGSFQRQRGISNDV